MYVVEENSLAHYGVKGMKWGVRKQRLKAYASKAGSTLASTKVGKKVTSSKSYTKLVEISKNPKVRKALKTVAKVYIGMEAAAYAGTAGVIAANLYFNAHPELWTVTVE